jgi:hypothetical protein
MPHLAEDNLRRDSIGERATNMEPIHLPIAVSEVPAIPQVAVKQSHIHKVSISRIRRGSSVAGGKRQT